MRDYEFNIENASDRQWRASSQFIAREIDLGIYHTHWLVGWSGWRVHRGSYRNFNAQETSFLLV